MRDLYAILIGSLVAVAIVAMGVSNLQARATIVQLEEKIARDSIMHEMMDSVEAAQIRWRNRCYEVAMEYSFNPEEVCDGEQ